MHLILKYQSKKRESRDRMLSRYHEVVVLATILCQFALQGARPLRVNLEALGLDHDQASVNASNRL